MSSVLLLAKTSSGDKLPVRCDSSGNLQIATLNLAAATEITPTATNVNHTASPVALGSNNTFFVTIGGVAISGLRSLAMPDDPQPAIPRQPGPKSFADALLVCRRQLDARLEIEEERNARVHLVDVLSARTGRPREPRFNPPSQHRDIE